MVRGRRTTASTSTRCAEPTCAPGFEQAVPRARPIRERSARSLATAYRAWWALSSERGSSHTPGPSWDPAEERERCTMCSGEVTTQSSLANRQRSRASRRNFSRHHCSSPIVADRPAIRRSESRPELSSSSHCVVWSGLIAALCTTEDTVAGGLVGLGKPTVGKASVVLFLTWTRSRGEGEPRDVMARGSPTDERATCPRAWAETATPAADATFIVIGGRSSTDRGRGERDAPWMGDEGEPACGGRAILGVSSRARSIRSIATDAVRLVPLDQSPTAHPFFSVPQFTSRVCDARGTVPRLGEAENGGLPA